MQSIFEHKLTLPGLVIGPQVRDWIDMWNNRRLKLTRDKRYMINIGRQSTHSKRLGLDSKCTDRENYMGTENNGNLRCHPKECGGVWFFLSARLFSVCPV